MALFSFSFYVPGAESVVRRAQGPSGVYKFLIFAPPTQPQNLIAGILSVHVRCSMPVVAGFLLQFLGIRLLSIWRLRLLSRLV